MTAGERTAEFDGEGLLAAFDGELTDVRELTALVVASVPKYIADLREAASRGDLKGVAAMAHTIRGSVGNVGATRLAELTRDVETAARAGGPVSAAALEAIDAAARDLVNAMSRWIDGLVAAART
ncbi:MAG: Hpt domain-containing protein [Vicinamibacterales bacterium]